MGEATITYLEIPEEERVTDDEGRVLYGAYRVERDGMVAFSPHSGFPGTVSAIPGPLDDPDFREMLLWSAERKFEVLLREREK